MDDVGGLDQLGDVVEDRVGPERGGGGAGALGAGSGDPGELSPAAAMAWAWTRPMKPVPMMAARYVVGLLIVTGAIR
ncbi:hypothetical protein GCM10029992_47160 [Glycomyces albus]